MNCEGCGYAFQSEVEVFGGIGQSFCFDCWQEEIELEAVREDMRREYDKISGIPSQAAMERCSDIESEIEFTTLSNQRRYSVIGRAV